MGAFELQVFVSLMVVLGAAFVALVCDVLKGSNEQLREANLELRVREDERKKHTAAAPPAHVVQAAERMPAPRMHRQHETALESRTRQALERRYPQMAGAAESGAPDVRDILARSQRPPVAAGRRPAAPASVATAGAIVPAAAPPAASPVVAAEPAMAGLFQTVLAPIAAAPASAATRLGTQRVLRQPAVPATALTPEIVVSLPEPVSELAYEIELEPAVAGPLPEATPAYAGSALPARMAGPRFGRRETAWPRFAGVVDAPQLTLEQPDWSTAAEPAREPVAEAVRVRVITEDALFAAAPPAAPPSALAPVYRPEPVPAPAAEAQPRIEYRDNVVEMPLPGHPAEAVKLAPAAETEAPASFDLPAGIHEAEALPGLFAVKTPFRGLVVAVAVANYERLAASQNPTAIDQMLESAAAALIALARRQDFFCRAGRGEFVLVFARETGAAAQRRMAQVAECLWDFQLRSLGALTIHFNWGAVECDGETFQEGLKNAREQMRQCELRRNGQTPEGRRRRVVNG